MNTLKRRLIALALLTCFAFASVTGCSSKSSSSSSEKNYSTDDSTGESDKNVEDNNNNNDSTQNQNNANEEKEDVSIEAITNEKGNPIIFPVQSGSLGNSGVSSEGGMSLDGPDPSSIDTSPKLSKPNGGNNSQPATEAIPVTNVKGESVTDAEGKTVFEYGTVASNSSSDNNVIEDYKSNSQGQYVLWVDISKNKNFVFNDEFIDVQFKIKDNIPDGDYPISIVTDFSSIDGVTIDPDKIINGTITVGNGSVQKVDVSSESGFVVYGDNVSCKQGDTIHFHINAKDNPGLAAILLWFYYDSNAMTVENVGSTGEFAKVSARPSTGTGQN